MSCFEVRQIHEESSFKRKRKNISKNTKKGETEKKREKRKNYENFKTKPFSKIRNFFAKKLKNSKKGKIREKV